MSVETVPKEHIDYYTILMKALDEAMHARDRDVDEYLDKVQKLVVLSSPYITVRITLDDVLLAALTDPVELRKFLDGLVAEILEGLKKAGMLIRRAVYVKRVGGGTRGEA